MWFKISLLNYPPASRFGSPESRQVLPRRRFFLLDQLLTEKGMELPDSIKSCIKEHLNLLCAEFNSYFNDPPQYVAWHKDPFFNVDVESTVDEAEELSMLKVSNEVKVAFRSKKNIPSFWLSIQDEYPLLSKMVLEMYVQCATTYLCESGFLELATIKTKARNRLDVRSDIRLAVSKTKPDIKGLLKHHQGQC